MNTKVCTQCKQQKDLINFNKNKRQKDRLQTTCKNCQKRYNQNNKDKLKAYYDEWLCENKESRKLVTKKYRQLNAKKYREYYKIYRLKPSFKESRRNYESYVRKNSVKFRIKQSLRNRIRTFLINGQTKSKSTEKILGCSYQELIHYLEQKFQDGMNWNNYGLYGWHIDHIIPLSSAKNENDLEKLCHYTNLQPLWAKDNLSKGDKII